MAGRSIGSDTWTISADERTKHDNQFFQLKPVSGLITGDQAKSFFLQSGLPTTVLGQIWSLADINADGKMDRKEFSIAMHLISKKLHGFELPRTLPDTMKQDPSPGSGSFGAPAMARGMPVMGSATMPHMQQPGVAGGMNSAQQGFASFGMVGVPAPGMASMPNGMPMMGTMPSVGAHGGFPTGTLPTQAPPAGFGSPVKMPTTTTTTTSMNVEWSVPQSSKLKYTQMFNMNDRMKRGHLTGMEARAILTKSGLVHAVLAQVWTLADIDGDGKLTCDEFVLAMHLVDLARSGQGLPPKLTPDLIPPSYRKSKPGHAVGIPPGGLTAGIGSIPPVPNMHVPSGPPARIDQFGELLGGFNVVGSAPSATAPNAAGQQPNDTAAALEADILTGVTFEDRRKENFDKGQAELDRRRQLLREQQQKENEERLAKERAEFEKREHKRKELEQKKQQELERQLEKQRQLEQHRDEERRKALEQREAARRELEHQRQLEWERQRRDQLMAEKQRMRSQVDEMHGVVSKYKVELEALDNKKTDLGTQIEEARNSVTNVTSQIDRMRQSRDMKIGDIDKLQQETQTWRNKLLLVQQERQQIEIKAQAVGGNVDDTYTTVMHSYNSKKTNIGKLKEKLAEIEKETATYLSNIDSQNTEFNDIQKKLDGLQAENTKLQTDMYGKKSQWDKQKTGGTNNKQNDLFGAFNSTDVTSSFSSSTSTSAATTTTTSLSKNDNSAWGNAFGDVAASGTTTTTTTNGDKTKDVWANNDFFSDTKDTPSLHDPNPDILGALKTDFGDKNVSGSNIKKTLKRCTSSELELTGVWNNVIKNKSDQDLFTGTSSSIQWGSSATPASTTSTSATDTTWNAFSDQPAAVPGTSESVPKPGYKKYRGLFQFEARNPDEVTFGPGDIIWVKPDQSDAEEGWLGGEVNGKEGWFPGAYAEEVPVEPGSQAAVPATTPATFATTDVFNKDSQSAGSTPSITTTPATTEQQSNGFAAGFNDDFAPAVSNDPTNPNSLTASVDSSFTAVAPVAPSPTPGLGQQAPDGLQAQAIYTWRAKKDNHLTFEKGDIILVKEQQDMWWSGELNGNSGWFPKSYVKVIGGQVANIPQSTIAPVESTPEPFPQTSTDLYQNTDFTSAPSQPSDSTTEQSVALYAYSSNEPGDLNFNQGEIIIITKKDGDWWHGQLGDRTGMFPANYVKMTSEYPAGTFPQSEAAFGSPEQPATADTVTSPNTPGTPKVIQASPVQSPDSEPVVQAASQPAQLTSNGQMPKTIKSPVNSLKKKVEENPPKEESVDIDSTEDENSQKGAKKGEIAQVIAPYQATSSEQLSLQPGQLIQVRKKSPSGWWEGELQARGQKRKIGWFPANYVKMLVGSGSARSTPAEMKSNLSTSPQPGDGGSRSATPVSLPAPTAAPSLEQVVALYNYAGQHDDELSFAKGSVINVLSKEDPDWWKGELNTSVGMFPSNYVAPLSEAFTDGSSQAQSSYNGEDVEEKRQKLIHELINSEEAYCKDLDILLNVFFKPFKQSGILSQEQMDALFVNLRDIRRCNIKMLNGFKVRKRTCAGDHIYYIGDILCENLPSMVHYVRFCSCQLNAVNLIQKLTEENPQFKELHQNCMRDMRTLGLPLGSFLLKPMQRITKYKLLIEKMISNTYDDHPDLQNLQEAYSKATELCNQINEGVNEKENSDKLEWIEAHVTCEGLSEKLTFNSVTNCLGPRKFLLSGSLYKAKSGKELVGFLFNDFILLTQPQQSLGSIATVFSFDMKADTQFRIYRTPLFLNEIMVKKGAEGENTLFHISHADRMYSLKAINSSERDSWVKKIEAASKHYLETEKKKREKAHQAHKSGSHFGRLLVLLMEGIDLVAADDNVRRQPAVGRILVVVMEGTDLYAGEDGKSDPYCEVSMGAQEHKTKVINNTLNPKWNQSMQFSIRDPKEDVLCITVYDRDLFTPNDFLGRTEIRIKDIFKHSQERKGPIIKRLKLYEVETGEIIVKLDLQLFEKS